MRNLSADIDKTFNHDTDWLEVMTDLMTDSMTVCNDCQSPETDIVTYDYDIIFQRITQRDQLLLSEKIVAARTRAI